MPLTAARRIEVDQIDYVAAPHIIHRVTRTHSAVNRSRLIGLSGTLILHGLGVSIFIPTPLTHEKRPPDFAGTSASQSVTAPADELVLLTIDGSKKNDSEPAAIAIDLRSQLTQSAVPLALPDQMPVIDLSIADSDAENAAQSNANPGDAELRAQMFGRYTGQISARIERAWEKPKSPVNVVVSTEGSRAAVDPDPSRFVCQVQIRQDEQRNVQEVLLLACNGTEAWRHSLVVAINQSSPLPAPPIPTVFKRELTMTFEGPVDQQVALPEVAAVDRKGERQ